MTLRLLQHRSDSGERAVIAAQGDAARPFDHGAWVPLMHLLPVGSDGRAPLPVFQVSLPIHFGTADAWRLGQALAPLRDAGIAVVGSGSMTHNLRDVQWADDAAPVPYVEAFAAWVRDAVARVLGVGDELREEGIARSGEEHPIARREQMPCERRGDLARSDEPDGAGEGGGGLRHARR